MTSVGWTANIVYSEHVETLECPCNPIPHPDGRFIHFHSLADRVMSRISFSLALDRKKETA